MENEKDLMRVPAAVRCHGNRGAGARTHDILIFLSCMLLYAAQSNAKGLKGA